jgi:hypothetical protein
MKSSCGQAKMEQLQPFQALLLVTLLGKILHLELSSHYTELRERKCQQHTSQSLPRL